jgi:hypothetical protein
MTSGVINTNEKLPSAARETSSPSQAAMPVAGNNTQIPALNILAVLLLTLGLGREALVYVWHLKAMMVAPYFLLSVMITWTTLSHRNSSAKVFTVVAMSGLTLQSILLAFGQYANVDVSTVLMTFPIGITIVCFLLSLSFLILLVRRYLLLPMPSLVDDKRTVTLTEDIFQKSLPRSLQVIPFAAIVFMSLVFLGQSFAFPPGPLCDDGMVLFMEGGCDWGESNIFFMSKVALLISINWCAVWCLRHRISRKTTFAMHFLLVAILGSFWWTDTSCDQFYGHPQGNLGQLTVEMLSLAALMLLMLPRFFSLSWSGQLLALLVINVWHVLSFYISLLAVNHASWWHTGLTSLITLAPMMGLIQSGKRKPAL